MVCHVPGVLVDCVLVALDGDVLTMGFGTAAGSGKEQTPAAVVEPMREIDGACVLKV